MAQTIDSKAEVRQSIGTACGQCGKSVRHGFGFVFKVPSDPNNAAQAEQDGQIIKCMRCAVRHTPMLRRSLIVAVVVGSILTALNQGDVLFAGNWKSALYWKIPLTYCVPLFVTTFGALSNCRR